MNNEDYEKIKPEDFMKNPLGYPDLKYRQREQLEERCSKILQKLIDKGFQEVYNRMWEVGKLLIENNFKRRKDDEGITELCSNLNGRMSNTISTSTLRACALFYKKYPDLLVRTNKTGLSPTHYQVLSSTSLSEEERDKVEKKCVEEKLSVRELKRLVRKDSEEKLFSEFEEERKLYQSYGWNITHNIPFNTYKNLFKLTESELSQLVSSIIKHKEKPLEVKNGAE